jgi:hypothetical protein
MQALPALAVAHWNTRIPLPSLENLTFVIDYTLVSDRLVQPVDCIRFVRARRWRP